MTLSDDAHDLIRRDIVNGTLAPEEPLRMDALKTRYGMGFSPLREALNRLQAEHMVIAVPQRGFAVAPVSPALMWDVIRTRIHIETRALEISIMQGDDDWEAAVVSSLHGMLLQARRLAEQECPTEDDFRCMEDRHRRFHRALIDACGSNWLLDFAAKLYFNSERYRFAALAGSIRGTVGRNVQDEHRRLADAATARDTARATELLTHHYLETGRYLESVLAVPQSENTVSD
ncbi:GntR family transcriptional regulator [Antarcticimicrobium sediminis]|uniref:FCD domain-containing protein n=1 Tax=Antarcticimicrobium sediminis TaxID=2546227 RepID=A0A4R5ENK1_9RHOB|nr:GntR family transcriptional regulator [Antarcticimicrobium sediminis]TDE36184.1 FCD domain-containing protein [Antarcticimicrobium sediminis]